MKKFVPPSKAWGVVVSWTKVFQYAFVQAFCASWFIVLATQLRVPFYPVPMTLQSLAIMLIALLATRRVAIGAVLLYLAYGAVGLPVFASGTGGLASFVGPTAGYLVGFVLMSAVIASLAERYPESGFWMRLGFLLLGNVFLFAPGIGFLAHLIGWEKAFQAGFLPFVWALPTKAALAACLSVYLQSQYRKA